MEPNGPRVAYGPHYSNFKVHLLDGQARTNSRLELMHGWTAAWSWAVQSVPSGPSAILRASVQGPVAAAE